MEKRLFKKNKDKFPNKKYWVVQRTVVHGVLHVKLYVLNSIQWMMRIKLVIILIYL